MRGESEPTTPRHFLSMDTLLAGLSHFPVLALCLSFSLSFQASLPHPFLSAPLPSRPLVSVFTLLPVSPRLTFLFPFLFSPILLLSSFFFFFLLRRVFALCTLETSLRIYIPYSLSRIWDLKVLFVTYANTMCNEIQCAILLKRC